MAIFRPPTDNFVFLGVPPQPGDSREKRLAYRLYRHYAPLPRGRNIYKLIDGSYVEDEPYDMQLVDITYYGGHDNVVTAQEAEDLTAAGYGAYIE